MFRIHLGSLIRSGTIAAAVAGFLLLIGLTPFFNELFGILLAAGALLIPVGAGIGYGYLAPGEETMLQSTVGGALSGLLGGFVLGIAFGVNAFMLGAVTTGLLGYAVASSIGVALVTGGIFAVGGAILGGLGGILWPLLQRQSG